MWKPKRESCATSLSAATEPIEVDLWFAVESQELAPIPPEGLQLPMASLILLIFK